MNYYSKYLLNELNSHVLEKIFRSLRNKKRKTAPDDIRWNRNKYHLNSFNKVVT